MTDIDQFMQGLERVGREKERRHQFAIYVEELQQKVKEGLITWADFRRLRDEWTVSHT